MNVLAFKRVVHGMECGIGPNATTVIAGRVGSLLVACVSDHPRRSKRELIIVAGNQTDQFDTGLAVFPASSYAFAAGALSINMGPAPERNSLHPAIDDDLKGLLDRPDLRVTAADYISGALIIPDPPAVLGPGELSVVRPPSFLGEQFEAKFIPYGVGHH